MTDNRTTKTSPPDWQKIVVPYTTPSRKRSYFQIANSMIPYAILWYLMYLSLDYSYWITLALSVLAAGFNVRIFIIFHDCGHGSFFRSRKESTFWGYVTGVLMFTPYNFWSKDHAIHHATSSDLDRRGMGDLYTLTVDEYLALPLLKRFGYRLHRNPFIMLAIVPSLLFFIRHRLTSRNAGKRENRSVHLTNLGIAGMIAVGCLIFGWKAYLLIQIPVIFFAAGAGVWMFYVQHQYEDMYWERHEEWDFYDAAMKGSSFYDLPAILHWFTGNIGYHHIHHLSPRIANYNLARCHKENPIFQEAATLTIWESLKSLNVRMWDEDHKYMVGYDYIKVFKKKQERVLASSGD